jgi:P-type Ca2+ transporter type 2C
MNDAHATSAENVLARFEVDPRAGLSRERAADLLAGVGPNALPPPKRPPLWRRTAAQFSSPLVLTLLAAAVISVVVGIKGGTGEDTLFARYGDAIAILLIVILNAVLGIVQESKAKAAVDALGRMSVPRARVRRGGEGRIVSATELVPGDILELEAGDAVPADARLVESTELSVDEASFSGESVPVEKESKQSVEPGTPLADRANMLFLGTTLVRGRALAVVTETGPRTELGRIGTMIEAAKPGATPLEAMLEKFGRRILWGCLAASAMLFAWGMLKPLVAGDSTALPWHFLLLEAVSLAVAAIPEGLPAITTITLALGTQRMAKRGAVVRKLPAVETLGAATFICTDKTGTLTQNVMMARALWTLDAAYDVEGEGYAPEGAITRRDGIEEIPSTVLGELLLAGALCNHADLEPVGSGWRAVGDPTEAALISLARRGGIDVAQTRSAHSIALEIAFESARRRMTVVTDAGRERRAWMKGALDVVLARSTRIETDAGSKPLDAALVQVVEAEADRMARSGLRVLALASSIDPKADVEADMTLLGLVGLMDPPRPGVKDAIAACHRAGIVVAMITGDHPVTAAAIAAEVGLWRAGDRTLTGVELDALSEDELDRGIERIRVFARTSPEQKLRIVRAIKGHGHIVAMTGDGVNDAPALREASIGVAMGKGGTEVARQASDLVLLDDDFSTIVAAVREGRVIYRNIQKFIFFLLSANAGLCGAVFLAALIADWPPYTPLMLLWINLVTNGLPALALGMDPPGEDVMAAPPRKLGEALLSKRDWLAIGIVGLVMTASSAILHLHAPDPELMLRARALGFSYLALGALLHAYSCTSSKPVAFRLEVFKRPLTIAVLISVAIHAVAILVPPLRPVFKTYPIDLGDLVKLGVLCLAVVPAIDLWKRLVRARIHFRGTAVPKEGAS